MSENQTADLGQKLSEALALEGFPVGVKMIGSAAELDSIQYKGKPVRKLDNVIAVCQLISQARFLGKVIAGKAGNLNICRLGGDAMGFDVDDYTHVYTESYFVDEKAARNMIDTMPKFERGTYEAMLVGPLHKIPVEPDVVVIYGNPAQLLRIVNGYLCDKGGRVEFSASGDAGLCSDTVVEPMQKNIPHLALPCNGGRILSLPNLTDLACGIPYGLIPGILDGMEYTTRNVPITYPPRWQHIEWELDETAAVRQFMQQKKK